MSITTYVKNWLDTKFGAIDDQIDAISTSVNTLSTGKQDKLTAGDGITITNNVISAVGATPVPPGDTGEWTRLDFTGPIEAELFNNLIYRYSEDDYNIGEFGYDVKIVLAPWDDSEPSSRGFARQTTFLFGPSYYDYSQFPMFRHIKVFCPVNCYYIFYDGDESVKEGVALQQGFSIYDLFGSPEVIDDEEDGKRYYQFNTHNVPVRMYFARRQDGTIDDDGIICGDNSNGTPIYFDFGAGGDVPISIYYRRNSEEPE